MLIDLKPNYQIKERRYNLPISRMGMNQYRYFENTKWIIRIYHEQFSSNKLDKLMKWKNTIYKVYSKTKK